MRATFLSRHMHARFREGQDGVILPSTRLITQGQIFQYKVVFIF